jgi:hypothetical protein
MASPENLRKHRKKLTPILKCFQKYEVDRTLPSLLFEAKITPIPKLLQENYRPLSQISILTKMLAN